MPRHRPRPSHRPHSSSQHTHAPAHTPTHTKRVKPASNEVVIYGRHSATHALLNPRRTIGEVFATPQTLAHPPIAKAIAVAQSRHANTNAGTSFAIHTTSPADLAKMTGDANVASQGIALITHHLPSLTLAEWLDSKQEAKQLRVVLGDQLQDPRNIGGILRSMWGFGGDAFITTHRHAPPITSALLKAASGAGEYVAVVGVGNLSQGIKVLQEAGFFVVGLDAGGAEDLAGIGGHERLALVVGSEGVGLRRLTRRRVDQLVRIPMYRHSEAGAESLNASVATAIALFVAMGGE